MLAAIAKAASAPEMLPNPASCKGGNKIGKVAPGVPAVEAKAETTAPMMFAKRA